MDNPVPETVREHTPTPIRKGLAKRVGPLPVWGWGVVVVAGVVVLVLARRRGSSGGADTGDPMRSSGSAVTGGSKPTGGGGGAGSGTGSLGVSPIPTPAIPGPSAAVVGPRALAAQPGPKVPVGAAPAGRSAPSAFNSTVPGQPGGFANPTTDANPHTNWMNDRADYYEEGGPSDDPNLPGYGVYEDLNAAQQAAGGPAIEAPRTDESGTYRVQEAQYDSNGNVVGWG